MSTKTATAKVTTKTEQTANNDQALAMHKAGVSKGRQPMKDPNKMAPGNKRVGVKGRY
jgi:hypothetical protein